MCAIGLIGNTLSLVVLHKSTGGNVGTYLLEALALTDNLFLAISVCIDEHCNISSYYNLSLQYYLFFSKIRMATGTHPPDVECLDDSDCRRQLIHPPDVQYVAYCDNS